MKKKALPIRKRKLEIENPSGRTTEQKGFDDMAAIMLGDDSKIISSQPSDVLSVDTDKSKSFIDVIKKEDNDRKKILLLLVITAIICMTLIIITGMIINHKNELLDGKLRVNYSSSDFEGANYKQVVSQLEKQGFTNIKTEPIDDLIFGLVKKDGEIENVKIDGYTSFSSNSRYSPDVEIIISYHTFQNKE